MYFHKSPGTPDEEGGPIFYGATNSTMPGPSGDALSHTGRAHQTLEDEVPREEIQNHNPGWKESLKGFYERNFGLFLVFLAQTCGSVVR